jgi:hypothetical protein
MLKLKFKYFMYLSQIRKYLNWKHLIDLENFYQVELFILSVHKYYFLWILLES